MCNIFFAFLFIYGIVSQKFMKPTAQLEEEITENHSILKVQIKSVCPDDEFFQATAMGEDGKEYIIDDNYIYCSESGDALEELSVSDFPEVGHHVEIISWRRDICALVKV